VIVGDAGDCRNLAGGPCRHRRLPGVR